MRPENLKTQIFLDSGDPAETKQVLDLLGFLDGQTTNPSLIAKKNPQAKARLESGDKFSQAEIYSFYKEIVQEIQPLIPGKSISIEVYVDPSTKKEAICTQAKEFASWVDTAHIKYPIMPFGLECASHSIQDGVNVNMTLCFSQDQAAAIHAIAKDATRGQVFISPFIGRLDDIGLNGMDLIKNCLQMYRSVQSPVMVLAASIRSLDHFMACLQAEVDIITAPFKILQEWAEQGMPVPGDEFVYQPDLQPIPYKELDLSAEWKKFDLTHEKTDEGIKKFAQDWNNLIK